MIPQKTIEDLITKHSNLEKDLSSTDLDKSHFAEKSKEYSNLSEIIEPAKQYLSFQNYNMHAQNLLVYKDLKHYFLIKLF